jgi:hypothetical protein
MPSLRSRAELAARVATFGLIGWLLGTSLIPLARRRIARANQSDVGASLAAWTRLPTTVALHVSIDTTPRAWIVDWLAALRHSGHIVGWDGSPPAVAISSEAMPDPAGGVRVDLGGPAGAAATLYDAIGTIDTLAVSGAGATAILPDAVGAITADVAGQRVATAAPARASLRSIVVLARAGWEGKFVVSALEERGWPVITRFVVAPGVSVTTHGPLLLDTSRVAAVIAIDTSVSLLGADVARYVQSGGGLVLAGPASLAGAVSGLAAGTAAERTRPTVGPDDTLRLGSTGFYPVAHLVRDGIALEHRAGRVSVAARRYGAGRVIQVGYDDTWRWRMAGAPGAEAAHRAWWSRVVGAVAYVPHPAASATEPGRAPPASAPLARMVGRLGGAQPAPNLPAHGPIDRRIFLAIIMMLLISEWASRRLRGLR